MNTPPLANATNANRPAAQPSSAPQSTAAKQPALDVLDAALNKLAEASTMLRDGVASLSSTAAPLRAQLQAPTAPAASSASSQIQPPAPTYRAPLPAPGTSLTRADFLNLNVVEHCGANIGKQHANAAQSVDGETELFVIKDLRNGLKNVRDSQEKTAASKLDPDKVAQYLEQFVPRLTQSAKGRVDGVPFNYYPAAMRLADDADRTVENHPDGDDAGPNPAWLMVLGRLDYTARLDDAGEAKRSSTLLDAYTQERFARVATPEEQTGFEQMKFSFNLLYYCYFTNVAFNPMTEGTEAGMAKQNALRQAELLLPRLRDNARAMQDTEAQELVGA